MKSSGCFVWAMAFLSMAALAQDVRRAPLNAAFNEQGMAAKTPAGHTGFGYRPPPVDDAPRRMAPRLRETSAAALPAAYDLRMAGKTSPVKDQGQFGTCWAFAACASLESCLLPFGFWLFSENNMANLHGFDYGINDGGNSYMALAYLARWSGPMTQFDDPYRNEYSSPGWWIARHVQEARILPDRLDHADNDAIKHAVFEHGAVFTAMHYEDGFYREQGAAYYYYGSNSVNHGVAIAGWDDQYPATNFAAIPPGNGAFIVKNSWGESWGENGYFHVSYFDKAFGRENVVFLNGENPWNHDCVYQYDQLGLCTSYGYASQTGWGANIFTPPAAGAIDAVSFYAVAPDLEYEVYVYTNVAAGAPRGGGLAVSTAGALTNAGYYTLSLPAPVALEAGRHFSVVVKFTTPGYVYPIPVEMIIPGYSSRATASPGESFAGADGERWADVSAETGQVSICIKAFGTSISTTAPARAANDFDGDQRSDIAVYDWLTGDWSVYSWTGRMLADDFNFGSQGFMAVPGDFDGDGIADYAVYSEAESLWFFLFSRAGRVAITRLGGPRWIPAPGDYDGDGRQDIALYEWTTGQWLILSWQRGFLTLGGLFGGNGLLPVPADYDGDGKTDYAVYHDAGGNWYILLTGTGHVAAPRLGAPGWWPVPGDFNGDGLADLAVYQGSTGSWFIQTLSGQWLATGQVFGGEGRSPAPGDYDGDGIADQVVFRADSGTWSFLFSSTGAVGEFPFGGATRIPVMPVAWY